MRGSSEREIRLRGDSGGGAAVRRRRRRLQHLESEIARANAERAELRRRLAAFEAIAAAAGVASAADSSVRVGPWRRGIGEESMPPELAAAARELRSHDAAVRLDVAGTDVVAVVGGPGDPREWWTAIWQFAGPEADGRTADRSDAASPKANGPAPGGPAPGGPAGGPAPGGPGPAGTQGSPA